MSSFRRFTVLSVLASFGLAACITPQPEYRNSGGQVIGKPAQSATGAPSNVLGCDRVIVVTARNTDEGIAQQNSWLQENYPGARKIRQRLSECAGKKVDVLTIETSNGAREDVYFDISSYFGKTSSDLDGLLDG